MAMKSVQELYDLAKTEIQNQDPTLTDWHDGSLLDIMAGVLATMISEVQRVAFEQFAKTFVETANGPEITGGSDDLERLLVDHFGEDFRRPEPTPAQGVVQFSRPTDDAGDCVIPAGTIVKTVVNAAGTSQRFATETEVTMTDLDINASVTAVVNGVAGNVEEDEVTVIESTLTDTTIVVNNAAAFAGGTAEATDSEYREFARDLLISLSGATMAAIEAKARTVAGVEQAVGTEVLQTVIEWDESVGDPIGDPFRISRNKLYVADANGTASAPLIDSVEEAIEMVRAAGVRVNVLAASAVTQNIVVSLSLNAGGPNYAELSVDAQPILDDIEDYVQNLPVGTDLVRATMKTAILAIWGPSGSGDLDDLTVVTPVGDVAVDPYEKVIPGTVGTV